MYILAWTPADHPDCDFSCLSSVLPGKCLRRTSL